MPLMRSSVPLAVALALCATAAPAMSIDPKAMARFDNSYGKCEARFPEMRGARDDAYLSLWRVEADTRSRAELAAIRKGAAYRAESRRVREEEVKKPPPAGALDAQCRALWSETQRARSLAR